MSKKKPLEIRIEGVTVQPSGIYQSKVVKSGNGAVINFYKKFVDKKVLVIIIDKIVRVGKRDNESLTRDERLDMRDWTEPSRTDPNYNK